MEEYRNGSQSFKRTLLSSAIFSLLLPSSVVLETTFSGGNSSPFDYMISSTTADEEHAYVITEANTIVTVDGEITLGEMTAPYQSVVSTTGNEAYAFNIINEGKLVLNYADVSTTNSGKTFNITTGASAEINNADIS